MEKPTLIPPPAMAVMFDRDGVSRLECAAAVAGVRVATWVEQAALERLARVERAAGRVAAKGKARAK